MIGAVEWTKTYAAECCDATSLRRMHSFTRREAAELKRLINLMRRQPEDAAVFKVDFNKNVEAMRVIEARLAELGVEM